MGSKYEVWEYRRVAASEWDWQLLWRGQHLIQCLWYARQARKHMLAVRVEVRG